MQSFSIFIYCAKSQKKKSVLKKVGFSLNLLIFKNCLQMDIKEKKNASKEKKKNQQRKKNNEGKKWRRLEILV